MLIDQLAQEIFTACMHEMNNVKAPPKGSPPPFEPQPHLLIDNGLILKAAIWVIVKHRDHVSIRYTVFSPKEIRSFWMPYSAEKWL